MINHLGKIPSHQVAERLSDARFGGAHMLRDVDVAAAAALSTDDNDYLEIVLGGFSGAGTGRTLVRVPKAP